MKLDAGSKAFFGFIAGFIILSLALTSFSHFTVGQQTCELAESVNTNSGPGSAIADADKACKGFLERWFDALTASPLYMPYYWSLSILGAFAGAGAVYYREG